MHAAVVTAFDSPPAYREFPSPTPRSADEVIVDVIATGLHPRVRAQADGSHYTSRGELPLVPGIDGVGRAPDGTLLYFVLPDTTMGAMAEQTVVDRRRSLALRGDTDPVLVAAAVNPVMSSWIALRRRIEFQPGQTVLILGATGSAGRMAVQVARHLGAGRVIGAGRDAQRLATLAGLGADDTFRLDGGSNTGDLAELARDVDVVIDYLWGPITSALMAGIAGKRTDPAKPLAWIEVGSVAGSTAEIPSAALRAARLQILGSGQGSVSGVDMLAEMPGMIEEITKGAFDVDVRVVPLTDVGAVWNGTATDARVVITP
ncbi:zinc-binding dehydrogenase [Mycobacterium parmense]|uniref:NADPH:quinone reductase n=1 Tax=Mycobacterium parmense TaxID=185642 RepID=A0A7I7YY99_9MYCO|nr:zinc-binding dehydrogenase [Mycobacterium parmense]MCV7352849.1 zinc-binding dehydrogenase [Mycobacterium parmense]ORW52813.1 quinone oxidoreductase [Mycobacterium parmense]BBZ46858.1 NADPH:quinone reductase [Mycobacterium parmense]